MPDTKEREILRRHAREIENYLLKILERYTPPKAVVKALLPRWKEYLEQGLPRVEPFSLEQLCAVMGYPTRNADNLKSDVARARKKLRLARHLHTSGHVFTFDIEERVYALKVNVREDHVASLRYFWACHLPPDGKSSDAAAKPVVIGIYARLFFSIDDELFLRASSVNTPDAVGKSPLLEEILSQHRYAATRQYVALGEVGAAFSLMEMFNSLGARPKAVKGNAEDFTNGLKIGSGVDERNFTGPAFPYVVVPEGISREGEASPAFVDDWKATPEMSVHVLLNRWLDEEKDSFVTAIQSGSSHAVEGVCEMLSHEKRVSLLLDAVKYQPSDLASQLIFKVGLIKADAGRKYSSVSVWDGEAFVRFWPPQPKFPLPKAANR